MRGKEETFAVERNGFEILKLDSEMALEDFNNRSKIESVYYEELRQLLKQHFAARRVEILEHEVRKRHPEFPVSTGEDYKKMQPTSIVHVDFTLASSMAISRRVFQVDPSNYERIQTVNIWKPLRGPLTDWPLALCDTTTVEEQDYIDADAVARLGFTENRQVYYNPKHVWYYLSKQLPSELLVFRQADTEPKFGTGVAHCGFDNPLRDPKEAPRESIEARAFIYY